MSSVKEPNYFARHVAQRSTFDVIKDEAEYLDLFRKAGDSTAIGEASVCYLWDPEAPTLIQQRVPNARIIILLRDPIERAFSAYLLKMKYSGEKVSFYNELIRDYESEHKLFGLSDLYVEFGMYYEQLKRYLDIFGKERVKIIIFEEFIKHKEETVNEVLSFLGVNYTVRSIREAYNSYSLPRNPVSLWIYAFFRWLRARNITSYKVINLLPDSLTESILEKYFFKKTQKPNIEPEAAEFLQDKYNEDLARLLLLLERPLPWPSIPAIRKKFNLTSNQVHQNHHEQL